MGYPSFGSVGLFMVLAHWVVSALALFLTSLIVPGFRLKNFGSALVASLIVGAANATVGEFLLFLTLPLNILTFGFFTFVIDAIVLRICARILRDFTITSWTSAIVGAVILAFVGTGLHYFLV
jgi:putative membrane protein